MAMCRLDHRRRGFTMIEMMIVICVISIVAMLVIPRCMAAKRRAKEAQLLADLKQLRDSIERFEATTGAWPPRLNDVTAANGDAISADYDGRGGVVDRTAYDGPYLVVNGDPWLPLDPFTQKADWNYDSASGVVHSRSELDALDESPYNTW